MATTVATEALEQWLCDNGGYLHPNVKVSVNAEAGYHWRATAALAPGTTITTVPHSLALSYLNALVDDAYPVFARRRADFGGVENIGFFYLMAQYLNRTKSFWKPYLETLPQPEDEFTTPMWFADPEDVRWLEGTDALHTMHGRIAIYEDYYRAGVAVLKQSGIDTESYTWDLFRWAVTISTSRSFSSRAITPQQSKYWTTHKTNPQGRRQTVLLDMSSAPSDDLYFPVLFPIQDIGNTSHDSHVDWTFDPGRFSIAIGDYVQAGEEVFNNYGSKANDELLIGYGFCVPNNPHDSILLTLKPPPEDLQMILRQTHPGYFTTKGEWNSEQVTFKLKQPMETPSAKQIFMSLPEAVLDLLIAMLRHERGLPFDFYPRPLEHLMEDEDGRRYLPFIARLLVQSLAPKLAKLQAVELPNEPKKHKQRQAGIYRDGQLRILGSTIAAMRTYTRSLLRIPSMPGSRFVTLEGLIELWSARSSPEKVAPFVAGIEACSGTADVDQLRQAGWEEDVIVLLLCFVWLESTKAKQLGTLMENAASTGAGGTKPDWVQQMLPEYVRDALSSESDAENDVLVTAGEDVEHAMSILELVRQASEAVPESAWRDIRWDQRLVVAFGKMLQYESMMMMVPTAGSGNGQEEARPVIYAHGFEM